MLKRIIARLRLFASRWQDVLFWLPTIFGLLIILHEVLPRLDPRSGIEGFGPVWDMMLVALGVTLSGVMAWMIRTVYGWEPQDVDDRELIDHACGIDRANTPDASGRHPRIGSGPASWQGVAIYCIQRFEWLATFWLLLRCFVPVR